MHSISFLQMVHTLERQDVVLGLFLLSAGVVFMLMGGRVFRTLILISFAAFGFVIVSNAAAGYGASHLWQVLSGLAGAVVIGLASTLVMKASVALLAGSWAGLAVLALAWRMGMDGTMVYVTAAAALAIAIALAVIMYDEIISVVTSFEGAILFVAGLIVFLSKSPLLWVHTRNVMTENLLFVPFLLLSGTIAGYCFQMAEFRQKDSGSPG